MAVVFALLFIMSAATGALCVRAKDRVANVVGVFAVALFWLGMAPNLMGLAMLEKLDAMAAGRLDDVAWWLRAFGLFALALLFVRLRRAAIRTPRSSRRP